MLFAQSAGVIIAVVATWILVAMLPLLIAKWREHANFSGVAILGLIGFFIPLVWIIALVWACIGEAVPAKSRTRAPVGYRGSVPLDFRSTGREGPSAEEILDKRRH